MTIAFGLEGVNFDIKEFNREMLYFVDWVKILTFYFVQEGGRKVELNPRDFRYMNFSEPESDFYFIVRFHNDKSLDSSLVKQI